MHPRSAEIRDRSYSVPVFLFIFFYSLILLGNTRYGGWILKIPPHAILRWTTAADRSFFSTPDFLVSWMMFTAIMTDIPQLRRVFLSFFFLRISSTSGLTSGAHHCSEKWEKGGNDEQQQYGIFAQHRRAGTGPNWSRPIFTHLAESHIWDNARQTLVVDKAEALRSYSDGLHRLLGIRVQRGTRRIGRCHTSRLGVEAIGHPASEKNTGPLARPLLRLSCSPPIPSRKTRLPGPRTRTRLPLRRIP